MAHGFTTDGLPVPSIHVLTGSGLTDYIHVDLRNILKRQGQRDMDADPCVIGFLSLYYRDEREEDQFFSAPDGTIVQI